MITTGNVLSAGALDKYLESKVFPQYETSTYFRQFAQNRAHKSGTNSYVFHVMDNRDPSLASLALTEGVTPSAATATVRQVEVTLSQYGQFLELTDIVTSDSPFDVITAFATQLGTIMAEKEDEFIQGQINAGTNALYAGTATSRVTVDATDTVDDSDLAKAAALLRANKIPKFENGYVAIVHPLIAHDIRNATNGVWLDASKYSAVNQIFKGEIGMIHGVRVIETDNIDIFADAGVGGTVDVYPTYILGQNAYGHVVDTKSIIYKSQGSAGTADALNQRSTIGFKFRAGAALLKEEGMYRLEGASSLGANS